MTMTPTGGIKEIVHVLPPKGNYYPYRLKVLEKAIQETPDSPVLPFLKHVVAAQNIAFEALKNNDTSHDFQKEEPFIIMNDAMLSKFKMALSVLSTSLKESIQDKNIDAAAILSALDALQETIEDPAKLHAIFESILMLDFDNIEADQRLFLLAAMQTTLHFEATNLTVDKKYLLQDRTLCPCCKMPAISSVLDNSEDGLRYLYCSFCETKWHVVRGQCTECLSNKSLYQSKIEELDSPMSAETCDECQTYLKFLDRTRTLLADPFIEDLLTLPLAIKLGEENYKTFGLNPYFI